MYPLRAPATKVIAHITLLYREVVKRIADEKWQEPNTPILRFAGRMKAFKYKVKHLPTAFSYAGERMAYCRPPCHPKAEAPAIAAGQQTVWTMDKIVALIDGAAPAPKLAAPTNRAGVSQNSG